MPKRGDCQRCQVSYSALFAPDRILGYNGGEKGKEAMSGARFTILARIDDAHFVAACPHGVAHLTWENATLRFTLDDFGALARLVEQATAARTPVALTDGNVRVAWQPLSQGEIQVGPAVLRLAPAGFGRLASIIREAKHRLDDLIASGAWNEPDRQESPPDPFQVLKQNPFSRN